MRLQGHLRLIGMIKMMDKILHYLVIIYYFSFIIYYFLQNKALREVAASEATRVVTHPADHESCGEIGVNEVVDTGTLRV